MEREGGGREGERKRRSRSRKGVVGLLVSYHETIEPMAKL